MILPPEDTRQLEEKDETLGAPCTASELREETALKATVNVSRGTMPLIDDKRQVTLLSLVQKELAQAVNVNRTPGDDATLANAWPESAARALPVVGTHGADKSDATGLG